MIPYGRHWIEEEDIRAVTEVLRGDWLTQGPRVEEFERRVADRCGARHAVAFSSGTAALHAAVFAAGAGPGTEIMTSPLSFAASANCALFQGAVPRFADVEKGGFNLDPGEVEKRWSERTKAVIPVDFAGHPADLDRFRDIAHAKGGLVIQDASHSLGGEYKGRPVGAQSDITTFSFHPVKAITTGEGGMAVTQSPELFERLRRFRTHGVVRPASRDSWFYEMVDLGYNYRLTDFQSALGISQLARLEAFLERRRSIAAAFDAAFKSCRRLTPLAPSRDVKSAYHLYVVQIDFDELGKDRAQVMEELKQKGVGSQVHYIPIHFHPYYRRLFGQEHYPEAEKFYAKALSLPLYPKLTEEEVGRVIRAVKEVVEP